MGIRPRAQRKREESGPFLAQLGRGPTSRQPRRVLPVAVTIGIVGEFFTKKATLAGGYDFENLLMKKIGGAEGDRTPDLCIANAPLSQLSYGPEECGGT